jgi:predicted dehydrogenase
MAGHIRFGIIGMGARASSIMRTFLRGKKGDIVALADLSDVVLERYQTQFEADLGHPIATTHDYRELLANPEVDAVLISTPDFLHCEMAVAAFEAGKHVFLEKPVGINLEQNQQILRAAVASGKAFEVGYVLRYAPFYAGLKRIMAQGGNSIIGRPLAVQATEHYYGGAHFYRGWWRLRKNVGGVMIQKVCHDMDMWCWLFGRPARVSSFGSNMEFAPGNAPKGSTAIHCRDCPPEQRCQYYVTNDDNYSRRNDECLYNGDHDIVDNTQTIVQFESGLVLSLSMNFFPARAQSDRFIRIQGSKAELAGRAEEFAYHVDPRHDLDRRNSRVIRLTTGAVGGHGGGDDYQILEFLDAIEHGGEARAGLESAYWSSILVMSAQIALEEHRVVEISEVTAKYPMPQQN